MAMPVVAAAGLVLASGVGAMAQPAAPIGFQLFCLQNPAQCRGGGDHTLHMDGRVMKALQTVNSAVNRSIQPRQDSGRDEWTLGARWGDCEDYVLTKRSELIRLGLPASALRIAYVKTRHGEDHAVLVVRSSDGDLTLDNLTGKILPLARTGHRVISMSGARPVDWQRG